jgi:hypothetical protein
VSAVIAILAVASLSIGYLSGSSARSTATITSTSVSTSTLTLRKRSQPPLPPHQPRPRFPSLVLRLRQTRMVAPDSTWSSP